ncbi:hypothetical protein IWQ56_003013, partial [Coemansia nantahalensis]
REAAKTELVAEAQAVASHRAQVIRMRRRLAVTGAAWDELFVPPMQHQPQARKRLTTRDPAQRARATVRKPRIASGLASAAAAAAGNGGLHPGMLGEPALPSPFVLPSTVVVHQYPVPRRLLSMASRIQTKTHVCESTLANGWIDATFPGAHPLHTNRTIDPPPAAFWAPRLVDTAAAGTASAAAAPLGFRLRRGRLGRLFVDRRQVHAARPTEDRLLRFRLGLLTPEDHRQLRECRTATWGADPKGAAAAAPRYGIPEELLRPFSFAAELATPATAAALADAAAQRLVPAPLSVAASSDTAVPTFAGAHEAQTVSPPLSAASGGSAPESLGTAPLLPAAGRLGSSAPPSAPHSMMASLSDKLVGLAASGPPTPLALSTKRSASVQAAGANGRRLSGDAARPPPASLSLNGPVLGGSVTSPGIAALSPQVASRSPAAIPNAAKCT